MALPEWSEIIAAKDAEITRLTAEVAAFKAGNRDLQLHFDVLKADYESLRAENALLNSELLQRDMTWLPAKDAENERLRAALVSTTASLVAAISLLERGGKKAAPSDTMFAMMLEDYQKSVDEARAALKEDRT
jgi:uncharacterized small protein (DUF1192 family)